MTLPLLTLCDLIRYGVTQFESAHLYYGHGTDNAFDEACFLTLEALHLPADKLDAFWHAKVTDNEKAKILSLFSARVSTRKPSPYLVNKAYLHGFPFYVDERVIVPRSFIADILSGDLSPAPENPSRILDLCTGSGCLAIYAAQLFPDAKVDAVDLSLDALAVADRNIADYGLESRVTLYQGDLFASLPAGTRYDLILTNPPYVDKGGMDALPAEFLAEPKMALDGGDDGLALVHRILKEAKNYLNKNGILICELGRCGPALQAAYPDKAFGWLDTENSSGEVFFISHEDLT